MNDWFYYNKRENALLIRQKLISNPSKDYIICYIIFHELISVPETAIQSRALFKYLKALSTETRRVPLKYLTTEFTPIPKF